MSDARSFGTLNLLGGSGGGEEYGVGVEMDVLHAPNGSITLDGVRDEPSWDIGAQLDLLGNYDFYTSYASEPDLEATASVLWGSAPEGASTSKAAQEGDSALPVCRSSRQRDFHSGHERSMDGRPND